jgi:ribonuclease BN (tRNA processing enzyme)
MGSLRSPRFVCALISSAFLATGGAFAQTQTAAKTSSRLITLGTAGGPQPRAVRAQSSNLLIVNGVNYIIDAGDGVARRLAKARINLREIGPIFITHGHDDHTGGLGHLMSASWDYQRTKPIDVYGPPRTVELVQAAVSYFNESAEIRLSDGTRTVPISKVFVGHDVTPGIVYQDGNVKVTAVDNDHFHFPAGSPAFGKFHSYAYRFETPDRVIVFTGDTGPSAAVTELAKGADVLVTEVNSVDELKEQRMKNGTWATMSPSEQENFIRHQQDEHLSPAEVGKMAAAAGVKSVILTHLTPTADIHDQYQRWADEVKKFYPGKVSVAKDLMEF